MFGGNPLKLHDIPSWYGAFEATDMGGQWICHNFSK